MKRGLFALLLATCALINSATANAPRQVQLLDKWLFIDEEVADAEALDTDTRRWQQVTVPHDWAIAHHFDMTIDQQVVQVVEDGDKEARLRTGRTGALPVFNTGWYRCSLPAMEDGGKEVHVEFDGAMSNAKVYLNGSFVGEWPYGYSSFQFDLSKVWNYGGENTLAVHLHNLPLSSRWYPGAGLYRNVRLVLHDPSHIAHWGTYITTPEVSQKSATVNIQTTINTPNAAVELVTTIYDNQNRVVAKRSNKIAATTSTAVGQELKISKPALWSPESPTLYRAVSALYSGKELLDEYVTKFGVRTIEYDSQRGFLLNGEIYKMRGVCLHHDLGPLGTAVNYRATERQLQMMKQMGCNAIRTSHNPPSVELLDICDSLGLLVQVEAFDEWRTGKNANGYNTLFDQWAERDLVAMIRRDRNHPSVVMWSIGNEIREQGQDQGWRVAQQLAEICRREDPTRPVTAGLNSHTAAIRTGLANQLDLVGFNYKPHDYLPKHKENPTYIIYGSETASTVSSRGDYKFPAKPNKTAYHDDYTVSSYDMDYVQWGTTPDMEFAQQEDNDFVFGEFVWTGFDYLGEPTPYNEGSPARSSYFGIVDLAGFPKDRFYLYQSHWSQEPMLHLLPHWNWPERVGQSVPVFCYTNYAKAELFVNGVSQGVREKRRDGTVYERYRLMWHDVIYQPGEITVVAYDEAGRAVTQKQIVTEGASSTLRLTPDRSTIYADGRDLSYITVDVVDAQGRECHRAENMIFVEVEGVATLRALCNGSSIDHTPFSSNYMRAYNGKLMIVVESTTEAGQATIKVSGGRLKNQTVKLQSVPR
ncbi:MAG: beta-galactosidase GalB [Rikenellaceae bacterium]